VGPLTNTDRVMRDTFWIGVWPGLTPPMLEWMVASFAEFFAARALRPA
jgi:CDP-6-deoxy-D-xylo-4-hexulose-3-dehydrase